MSVAKKRPEDFLPLSPTQMYILLALAEEDLHGYGIMQNVKDRTDGRVKIGSGTLYSALDRMIEQGWIEETDPPKSPNTDERRRYYHITPTGTKIAEAEARRLLSTVKRAQTLGLLGSF